MTCVSYTDIMEYCDWADVRLPTLEEWEVASRGDKHVKWFWGSDKNRIHEFANVWTNKLHSDTTINDKHLFTAPVGSYEPNSLGLFDVYGNVFEFCSNRPPGSNLDNMAYARGGSWWCSTHSCAFFNSIDIGKTHKHASFSNQGFRVVKKTKSRH